LLLSLISPNRASEYKYKQKLAEITNKVKMKVLLGCSWFMFSSSDRTKEVKTPKLIMYGVRLPIALRVISSMYSKIGFRKNKNNSSELMSNAIKVFGNPFINKILGTVEM